MLDSELTPEELDWQHRFRTAETDDEARLLLAGLYYDDFKKFRGMVPGLIMLRKPVALYHLLVFLALLWMDQWSMKRGIVSEEAQHKIKYRALT